MGINPSAPGAAHHALITDLHALHDRYKSLPAIERVAVISQFLGQVIVEVPTNAYSSQDVLQAVAMNLASGNANAGGALAVPGLASNG